LIDRLIVGNRLAERSTERDVTAARLPPFMRMLADSCNCVDVKRAPYADANDTQHETQLEEGDHGGRPRTRTIWAWRPRA